jgi:hypothetical protein
MKALVLCLLGFGVASSAHADWVKAVYIDFGDQDSHIDRKDRAMALAETWANGHGMSDNGGAVDSFLTPYEVFAGSNAVGKKMEVWQHVPTPGHEIGEVEYHFDLDLQGFADLQDAECAGYAGGSESVAVYKDGTLVDKSLLVLTKTAGETKQGALGLGSQIPVENPQTGLGSIPVDVGNHVGEYREKLKDHIHGTLCPVVTFAYVVKTTASAKAWADEFWGIQAAVKIGAKGHVYSLIDMIEFSVCP